MEVRIGDRWQPIIDTMVKDGGYADAGEVVIEALALLRTREAKLAWLREKIDASVAGGGWQSAGDVRQHFEQRFPGAHVANE